MRKSSDQRSVDSSPRLIAASYVLHRLLVPRHPPCALNNLATQKHRTTSARKDTRRAGLHKPCITESEDARVHCAVLNVRPDTPHPTPPNPTRPAGRPVVRDAGGPCHEIAAPGHPGGPLPQDPTACLRPRPAN